jgi:hypothetical protein
MLGMGEGYQISDISDQRLAISDQEARRRGTVTRRSQRKNTEGTEKSRKPKRKRDSSLRRLRSE